MKDKIVETWLETEFTKKSTQMTYRSALNKYKDLLEIKSLETYLKSEPNVIKDMKTFLARLKGAPPKTIKSYSNAVKLFLEEHAFPISKEEWKQLRRRGHRPKNVRARTRDKINTKPELRQIVNHMHLKMRSLTLFMLSSGARLGESLTLEQDDLDLDAEPVPLAYIKDEHAKNERGRPVPMSFEARDVIKDWLQAKKTLKKRSGGSYDNNTLWAFTRHSARWMWNEALRKADLDERCKETDRRVYHLHGLRKFFRSKIRLDREQFEIILGHSGYLDEAYLRYTEQDWLDLWAAYLEVMPNVSIYDLENSTLRETIKAIEQERDDLKTRLEKLESRPITIEDLINSPEFMDQFAQEMKKRLIAKD